ncbi:MAG: hypothetical protein ACI9CA_001138 [Natronomonas sp.]|jgi:hypothetical protein
MDNQQRVAAFVAEHDLETPPAYRLLDLVSEVGELGAEVTESTGYGESTATNSATPGLGCPRSRRRWRSTPRRRWRGHLKRASDDSTTRELPGRRPDWS